VLPDRPPVKAGPCDAMRQSARSDVASGEPD
jgi:hypothetical protein